MASRTSKGSSLPISAVDLEFRVGKETTAMYGAAAHYWRLERGVWDTILDKVRGMGFTFISIYIPWKFTRSPRANSTSGRPTPATISTPSSRCASRKASTSSFGRAPRSTRN